MNFLEAYKKYTKDSEAPANFHFWCAMVTVSSCLSRKCYMPQGMFTVYPNLYVMLVGRNGSRKSTAKNLARDIIREMELPVTAEATTREALIDWLRDNKFEVEVEGRTVVYHPMTAIINEMSEFLGASGDRLVSFLVDVWDNPLFEDKTRKHGLIKIPGPYLNMLGCTTTEWVYEQMRTDIITGGFSRRTLFVYEDELQCYNPWPVLTAAHHEAYGFLIKEARRICKLKGSFTVTHEALEWWEHYYITGMEELKNVDYMMQGYQSSKHTLALKIAMCLNAIRGDSMILAVEDLQDAADALQVAEINMSLIYTGVGRNDMKSISDKIVNYIYEGEGHSRMSSEVWRRFERDANMQEMNQTIEYLVKSKRIRLTVGNATDMKITAAEGTTNKPRNESVWKTVMKDGLAPKSEAADVKITDAEQYREKPKEEEGGGGTK